MIDVLYEKVIRALVASFFSTLFMTIFMNLYYEGNIFFNFLPAIFGLFMWFTPIILIYGIPITILSEFITKRFIGMKRMLLALVIYMLFGMVFGVLLPSNIELKIIGADTDLFVIAGTISAFIFWIVDEYSKCRYRRNSFKSTLLN